MKHTIEIIPADDSAPIVFEEFDRELRLEDLYSRIGCNLVEVVHLDDGKIMIVDEEGLIARQEPNLRASERIGIDAFIVGTVVICDDAAFP